MTDEEHFISLKDIEANFADIHPPLRPEEAAIEANRCLYCYDAPCITACPTHIEVPRFIKQIASKNLAGSARTILEANPMGHSCARVCPVEALCEGACVYHDWHQRPIEIARLQRFSTDRAYDKNMKLFEPCDSNNKEVAIVGAGPAGLSAAFYLARLGYQVTVFEKRTLAGGLNTYGIAEYKMTRKTSLAEVKQVEDLGVKFERGVEVGKNLAWGKLEQRFDAIFIAVGLGKTQNLNIPGENLKGVVEALHFIEQVKTRRFGSIAKSQTTVVIGAGNTAIDAVTQAKRLGTPKVIMAYRRSQAQMSAYQYEYNLAKQDAIEFLWNTAPSRILGKSHVEAIELVQTETLTQPSAGITPPLADPRPWSSAQRAPSGRGPKVKVLPGSKFEVPCDRVIVAIGQEKQRPVLEQIRNLGLDASGRITVNPKTLQSSNPRYFAGGDAINGGKEVVNAVADGKRAAWAIHRYLGKNPAPAPEHAYWVSTIEGRKVAPPPARNAKKHEPKKELARI